MKAIIATSLALATLAAARPSTNLRTRQSSCLLDTVSNPSTQDIENAINQWASDVSTVNSFLDAVAAGTFSTSDPADLQAIASAILVSASDEPCQFQTLQNNADFQGGVVAKLQCAIDDLSSVFQPHVLDNLNDIINNPSDADIVSNAVQDINNFRCCNVLPDVDTLFLDSAVDSGISDQVPLSVPREQACASITCTPACQGLDNGSAGK